MTAGSTSPFSLTRIPTLRPEQLVRAIKRAGFVEHGQRGSHLTLKHPIDGRRTVVPLHGRDVKRSLMRLIMRQCGITESALRQLL